MSKQVTIYTTRHCPHCARAKGLLRSKNITFKEVDLTEDDNTRTKLEKQTGWMTVPMIFVGDEFLGGARELDELEAKGELGKKLA